MPVQSHRNGWRACKKHAGQWFIGPVRQSVQAAEEDSRSLDEASAVSVEALRERCRNLATTNLPEKMHTVERRSTGWRLFVLGQKAIGVLVPREGIKRERER